MGAPVGGGRRSRRRRHSGRRAPVRQHQVVLVGVAGRGRVVGVVLERRVVRVRRVLLVRAQVVRTGARLLRAQLVQVRRMLMLLLHLVLLVLLDLVLLVLVRQLLALVRLVLELLVRLVRLVRLVLLDGRRIVGHVRGERRETSAGAAGAAHAAAAARRAAIVVVIVVVAAAGVVVGRGARVGHQVSGLRHAHQRRARSAAGAALLLALRRQLPIARLNAVLFHGYRSDSLLLL